MEGSFGAGILKGKLCKPEAVRSKRSQERELNRRANITGRSSRFTHVTGYEAGEKPVKSGGTAYITPFRKKGLFYLSKIQNNTNK